MMQCSLNKLTKTELAKSMGISRSSLYYQPKRPAVDQSLKKQIQKVLATHPSYGHKRIAMALKLNKKRILRVMKKFNLKPYRRRTKRPVKKDDLNKSSSVYQNEIKNIFINQPNLVWAADFTYLAWQGKFIYLATIIDVFTREIIGWNISKYHHKQLVLDALNMAFKTTNKTPVYHHSDQGSEYESIEYINELKTRGIIISMSAKAHPWENPFQESFYSQFKVDFGRTDRFETLGELMEAVCLTVYYYNNKRIHTKLKMPPCKFKNQYLLNKSSLKSLKNTSLQTYRQLV